MDKKKIAIGAVVALIVAQLVPVDRSNPPVESEVPAPAEVRAVLQRSCYDCHSNESRWPWYAYVAPISWLVAYDVHEARGHMNFSTWDRYSAKDQAEHLKESGEAVLKGEMPLWYYLPLHPEAQLSEADRELIRQWSGAGQKGAEDGDDSADEHEHEH